MTKTITVEQAAELARRSPQTVRRWCREGEVKATRVPRFGDWRIDKRDLLLKLGME
ncbi:MAG: helix-turn-helix domain-containing protein [Atopobiaceae bacterium]|nr:helix-turn-helix domain-containing protein [Atopobiaceae bacterium]